MEKLVWHTEGVRWVDMIPFGKNARKMKAENSQNLANSLEQFDVVDLPTLDDDNVIIGGHQRRRTMIAAGRGKETTDARKPNRKLTEEEFKQLNLILNSSKYQGEFDLLMLRENFSDFNLEKELGVNFDELDKDLEAAANVGQKPTEAEYPIVAKMSESYHAFIIVCKNSIDENHVAELLGVDVEKSYKGTKIGRSHVITAEKFSKQWEQKSVK
jgi:histidinol phosphatase-like enzyme